MSMPRRPLRYVTATAAVVIVFIFLHFLEWQPLQMREQWRFTRPAILISTPSTPRSTLTVSSPAPPSPTDRLPRGSTINETLGFGRIYAVSAQGSPRRNGLVHAANVTELEITIAEQPRWTDEDVANFKLKDPIISRVSRGSALAWLGHLHTIQRFIESGAETALILEDDVDWDVRLRSVQAPLVATAVRKLVGASEQKVSDPLPATSTPDHGDPSRYPYGDPKKWDLLYLGHCGDYFQLVHDGFTPHEITPLQKLQLPYLAFHDPSMLLRSQLHPWTGALMEALEIAEQTRLIHRSVFPLCSFGYAITRPAALRLVNELAGSEAMAIGASAYDVTLLVSCRDRGLRCWSVNPELFHHVIGRSLISAVDDHELLMPVDQAGIDIVNARGESINIGCGFWKGAFDFDDDDGNHLEWLRQEIARKGRCTTATMRGSL